MSEEPRGKEDTVSLLKSWKEELLHEIVAYNTHADAFELPRLYLKEQEADGS